jgi:hypothetical protein
MPDDKRNADKQWKIYQQVKRVFYSPETQNDPDLAKNWALIDDYIADMSSYDVYVEDKEAYLRDNYGERPRVPLSIHRDDLKDKGFHFKRDGQVLFKGRPASDYAPEPREKSYTAGLYRRLPDILGSVAEEAVRDEGGDPVEKRFGAYTDDEARKKLEVFNQNKHRSGIPDDQRWVLMPNRTKEA